MGDWTRELKFWLEVLRTEADMLKSQLIDLKRERDETKLLQENTTQKWFNEHKEALKNMKWFYESMTK